MKDTLFKLLNAAILKSLEKNNELDLVSFNRTMNLLINEEHLFEDIPKSINRDLERFKEIENTAGSPVGLLKDIATSNGKYEIDSIKLYPEKGILLYDKIHGSAFGRMSYIYKSKGTRLFLFKDLKIDVVSTYCTIDHHGFNLANESYFTEVPDFTNETDIENVHEIFNYIDVNTKNLPLEMLKLITHIKEPFSKDYYIEYLLFPPDVDKISSFSLKVQEILWDICFDADFQKNEGDNTVYTAIELLVAVGIVPNPIQLLSFIKRQSNINSEELRTNMESIMKLFEKKPLITAKIGVGMAGSELSIDINEAVKRLIK